MPLNWLCNMSKGSKSLTNYFKLYNARTIQIMKCAFKNLAAFPFVHYMVILLVIKRVIKRNISYFSVIPLINQKVTDIKTF